MAALVLQKNPSFTPDDVKCALMGDARPATWADGRLAYGVSQQSAGFVDPYAAAYAVPNGCVDASLDLAADLPGIQRFGGPAWCAANGTCCVLEQPRYEWNGTYRGASGYPWSNGHSWSSGLVEPAAVNAWVDQEKPSR